MAIRLFSIVLCVFGAPDVSLAAQDSSSPSPIDFQREVQPILADKCFRCHGPDESTRQVRLRLDMEQEALAQRPNGRAIVPGAAEESLVYQRITSSNESLRMPPVTSNTVLSDGQVDILKRWIDEGASWERHWSFRPIGELEPPSVLNETWPRNEIDRFVLSRLESERIVPAPEADRPTLARRLALDLTGLPLEPERLEQFLLDESEDAYANLVDELLGSVHWGEHRARYWLDAARFGDTHGIHIDNYREMYPYRDWVIKALNDNQPFNEFVIDQIAGDLLPNPSLDQLVATGFQRNNITTNEGGVVPEEYEAIYAKDRAETIGGVFLGLTIGCATCHDHKFDPIPQREFYAMTAFFRNTTQYVMDGNVSDPPPVLVVPEASDRLLWTELRQEALELEAAIGQRTEAVSDTFGEWLSTGEYQKLESPLDISAEGMRLVIDNARTSVFRVNGENQPVELNGKTVFETGPYNEPALMFGEESWVELPPIDLDSDTPFSIAVWIFQPEEEGNYVVAGQNDASDGARGWSMNIGSRLLSFRLTGDEDLDTGRRPSPRVAPNNLRRMEPGQWTHIVVTHDGTGERSGMEIYRDGDVVEASGSEYFTKVVGSIRTDRPLELGRGFIRGRDGGDELEAQYFAGGGIADFRVFGRALTVDEAKVVSLWPLIRQARDQNVESLTEVERDALRLHYLSVRDRAFRELSARKREIANQWREMRRRGGITHVMNERTDTDPTARVLFRGMYDQPRELVLADVPSVLPAMKETWPRNRLGLANWIVDKENPLTSRVTVNRYWQEVFGVGLVTTSEDFGAQGDNPTHPELLDWLAVEFRRSGWDVKEIFRTLVTSATYRQASQTSREKLERDPENRLLSRGPRFRMDAEMLRDYALAASGLLVRSVGGPSVRPYQPQGVWSTVAMEGSNTRTYTRDDGEDLYRRSLYTFWKRSAPPPSMEIFNAPTREHFVVRRERTNTPLQALVTMNDPQFVEASRYLAQRAIREGGSSFDERVDFITIRLLSRLLKSEERAIVRRTYLRLLEVYTSDRDEATALLVVGESTPDFQLSAEESAAWTMIVNQLMNLDEVLNK